MGGKEEKNTIPKKRCTFHFVVVVVVVWLLFFVFVYMIQIYPPIMQKLTRFVSYIPLKRRRKIIKKEFRTTITHLQ